MKVKELVEQLNKLDENLEVNLMTQENDGMVIHNKLYVTLCRHHEGHTTVMLYSQLHDQRKLIK